MRNNFGSCCIVLTGTFLAPCSSFSMMQVFHAKRVKSAFGFFGNIKRFSGSILSLNIINHSNVERISLRLLNSPGLLHQNYDRELS